jgi:hypothetical protein
MIVGFNKTTVDRESEAVRLEYARVLNARNERLAQTTRASTADNPVLLSACGSPPGVGSVYVHGTSAVRPSSLMAHVQRMNSADVDAARRLLFRWLVTANLPLSAFDNAAWLDFLHFVAPAFAPHSINRAYIRCVAHRLAPQAFCAARAACALVRALSPTPDRLPASFHLPHLGWLACRNHKMIAAMYEDVRAAVEGVLLTCPAVCLAIDGWTDDKHQQLVNACIVAFGLPFWSYQVTPKGERHTIPFFQAVCKEALARPNLMGAISDSPSNMVAFRGALVNQLQGRIHPLACDFHVTDKMAGDLMGKGPEDAKPFIIPQVDLTSDTSIVSLARDMVKYFNNHGVPNGVVRDIRDEVNKHRRSVKLPRIITLRLAGETRKTSVATALTSVSQNRTVLRNAVLDERWDKFVANQGKKEDRQKAESMAKFVRNGPTMDEIDTWGRFLSLFQVKQRVCEMRDKNLSDLVYDTAELLRRVQLFEGVPQEVKDKARKIIVRRFDHTSYNPSVALAWRLDPLSNDLERPQH